MFRSALPKFTLSLLSICLIIGAIVFSPAKTIAQSPNIAQQLQAIAHAAEEGALAAKANDVAKTQHEYLELHEIWENIEDDVQAQNPTAYFEIETAVYTVRDAVQVDSPSITVVYESFET